MYEIPPKWLMGETYGPREVGKLFDVDPRTITKWAQVGHIGFFRTPTGMRRFPECEVLRVMAGEPPEDPEFLKEFAKQDSASYKEKWRGGWRRDPRVTKRVGHIDNPEGNSPEDGSPDGDAA